MTVLHLSARIDKIVWTSFIDILDGQTEEMHKNQMMAMKSPGSGPPWLM
jgi:hypothetical protein